MGAWGPRQGHQHWWVPGPAPRSPVISLGGLGPQNRADGLGETPLGMSGGGACTRAENSCLSGLQPWQGRGLVQGAAASPWAGTRCQVGCLGTRKPAPELPPQPEVLGRVHQWRRAAPGEGCPAEPRWPVLREVCVPRGLQEEARKAIILGLQMTWKARETWVGVGWEKVAGLVLPSGNPRGQPRLGWGGPWLCVLDRSPGFRALAAAQGDDVGSCAA